MKLRFACMALALFSIGLTLSCSKDEEKTEVEEKVTAADMSKIKSAVEAGTWSIAKYSEADTVETLNYAGFGFTFNGDGTLVVTDGNTSVSGAWSLASSDMDELDFNIFFTSPDIFEVLSDDWEIKSYSNSKIELIDTSDDDSTIDYLTFEKL